MTQHSHLRELLHDVDGLLTWQEDFYRDLHLHPELSHQEERTAQQITTRLEAFDCEVTTGIGGHGITAVFRNNAGSSLSLIHI